ncbi:hypothetical protein O1Q96_05795 [Streptomyces sp. Qhu-G9]|uniref:hypothetical protein n=1 Tax=Streptomyces sp. Qhu-G9 TaxID=3452799 RepID=UPI0022ABDEB9|nr:hypothetical protein [Streptomyces aurantiacus]WAU79307.1 hypothetical protein O1Q96_05795 [Streptomyces aurantiacus]
MDGVSTYLALIFGTLLSSQGTDASFVLTLSGFPPGASLRVSNLTRSVFRSVSGRDSFPVASWEAFAYLIAWWLSFGESDFIRSF